MVNLLVVLGLVALAEGDSVLTAQPRAIHVPQERMGLYGTVLSTEGHSVASTRVEMKRMKPPYVPANAEYMSVGPPGPTVLDTVSSAGFHVENPVFHRLRVTVGSSERITWMMIDDIVTGRADTRTVNASYMFSPFGDLGARALWAALQKAPRVLGPEPTGPPIAWLGPKSFTLTTPSDTFVFEQKADSIFRVTLRARVR